jgi:hypothetical protein
VAKPVPDHLEADVQIEDNLRLAAKAMEAGKFDKAIAYTLIAITWQTERSYAESRLPYKRAPWPSVG